MDWAVIQHLMGFEVHLETPEILEQNLLAHQLRMSRDFATVMTFVRLMILISLKVEQQLVI